MNLLKHLLCSATAGALALGLAVDVTAQCVYTSDGTGLDCRTLYAGQTTEAGSVCAEVVGEDLLITYSTSGDWELVETHLWIGRDMASMPQTRKGNPIPGQFPWASGDISGATSHTVTIPLIDLAFGCPDSDDETFFVAAHAALRRPDGNGGYQTETGWGDGDRFVQKGNWGTFFDILLACDCTGTGAGGGGCETAFAYGDESARCFLSIDEDGDGEGDFNRWGWTNGPLAEGFYTFPILAGAGQCDQSHGTYVGELTVSYTAGTATLAYTMFAGYTMDETHVYVGNEILARNVNNAFTVAPGQYPHKDDHVGASAWTYVIPNLDGDIYVVAHAVTCGAGNDNGGGGGDELECGDTYVSLPGLEDELAAIAGANEIVRLQVAHQGGNAGQPYFRGQLDVDEVPDGIGDYTQLPFYCIDLAHTISSNTWYCARLYSSYSETLPSEVVVPENFDLANWILNNYAIGDIMGDGTALTGGDIQRALWQLIYGTRPGVGAYSSGPSSNVRVDELIAAANAGGEDYVPGCDEVVAVLVYPVQCAHPDEIGGQVLIAQMLVTEFPQVCETVECPPEPCVATADASGVDCQVLYAGQTIDAGTVCAEIVNEDLVITYATTGGWELMETHLWLGTDMSDYPQTNSGNPIPGQFPYNSGDITGATSYSVAIPLVNLDFSCPGDDLLLYVGAHAALRRDDGTGGYQTETGWGDGDRFVEQGNWGTRFDITLTCCVGDGTNPGPALENCQTAFAFGGSGDTDIPGDDERCFLNSTLNISANRWGWTNPIEQGQADMWPLFAGAGQCVLGNGTHVGWVFVDYSDGANVLVSFEMFEGYAMEESHVYVGATEVPYKEQGNGSVPTVAPGSYPGVHDDLGGAVMDSYSFPATGTVYVIAHASVCEVVNP